MEIRTLYLGLTILAFLAFALNNVVPLIDLPLVGLSITSPLIFYIFLKILSHPLSNIKPKYSKWLIIIAAIMGWYCDCYICQWCD